MATRKVPGLAKSKGMQGGFRIYKKGKYALQCTSVKVEDVPEKKIQKWQFKTVIADGPTQDDGADVTGKGYTHFLTLLMPEHASFEEWGHIGVDELYSMAEAFGVPISKSDNIDPDAFVSDAVAIADMGQKTEEYKGETKTRNVVYSWAKYSEE